jgi:tetratricopeptide (TPR) repeat protein
MLLIAGVFVVFSKIGTTKNSVQNQDEAIGVAYQSLANRDYDQTISSLAKIDGYSADNKIQAYSALGQAYYAKKDFGKSIENYQSAEDLESSASKKSYYENLVANSMRDKGDVDGAVAEYQLAVKSDANNTTAWVNMVNALKMTGDVLGAKTEIADALSSNPNNESIKAIEKTL